MTRGAIEYRLRPDGPWRQILPGVYLTVTGLPSQEQREAAALLYAGPQSVITGAVAVRRHNLRALAEHLDVLVPADNHRKSTGYVQIQRTTRMPGLLYTSGPLRFTAPVRAVADAARGMTRFSDVQALVCEAIQRGRCGLDELVAELKQGPSGGARWYRMALAEVSEGIRSAAEAQLKHLIDRSDLDRPVYNADLYTLDGLFLGRPDAWFARAGVAGEVDSRQYHLRASGLRGDHPAPQPDGSGRDPRAALAAQHDQDRAEPGHRRPACRHRGRQQMPPASHQGHPAPRLTAARRPRSSARPDRYQRGQAQPRVDAHPVNHWLRWADRPERRRTAGRSPSSAAPAACSPPWRRRRGTAEPRW